MSDGVDEILAGVDPLDNPALRRLLEAASRHRMPASGDTDTEPSHNRL